MFPMALVTGNTYVMKPSEQDPLSTMFLCKLAMDAGVPDGVLNIIHGTKPCKSVLIYDVISLSLKQNCKMFFIESLLG